MSEASDIGDRIRNLLSRTPNLTLTKIADTLQVSKSGVHYQLKKMLDSGVIGKSDESHYYLSDIEQVEKEILKFIIGKEISESDISSKFSTYGAEKVVQALQKLVKRELVEITKNDLFKISPDGSKELDICYFCNEKVDDDHAVLTTAEFGGDLYYGIISHVKCYSSWLRDWIADQAGWIIGDDIVCDYCGLPLDLRNFLRLINAVYSARKAYTWGYVSIEKHLSMMEKKILENIKETSEKIKRISSYSDIDVIIDDIIKYDKDNNNTLSEHDSSTRKKELWDYAQIEYNKLVETHDFRLQLIKNSVHKIYDPLSILYAGLNNDWIIKNKDSYYISRENSFIIKNGGEKYHIYCDKLRRQQYEE